MWDLLALIVRSNDNAEGHDFAELLLGTKLEQETETASENQDEDEEIDVTSNRSVINSVNSVRNVTTGRGYSEQEKIDRFRELIQFGRQRDALEWAMKTGQWGHALMLRMVLKIIIHKIIIHKKGHFRPWMTFSELSHY